MKELIENLANNNYVIIGLSVLLGILIIMFFVLLFSKNKTKKPQESKVVDEENIAGDNKESNIDFDHSEYVKETTAEFELTPITDVQPQPDGFVPEVSAEESPAIDMKTKTIDDVPLKDFDFDELSKSISQEIENLKLEEANKGINPVETENTVDTFKQIDDIKPIEVTKVDNINTTVNTDAGVTNPTPEVASFNEFIIDAPTSAPTPAPEAPSAPSFEPVSAPAPQAPAAPANPEPVISDTQTPLFASFNPETFDISNKD